MSSFKSLFGAQLRSALLREAVKAIPKIPAAISAARQVAGGRTPVRVHTEPFSEDEDRETMVERVRREEYAKFKAGEVGRKAKAEALAEAEALIAADHRQRVTAHRDADVQNAPYRYCIGRHGNEALAYRHGIVNTEQDTRGAKPACTILIQKTRRARGNLYHAILPEFGQRSVLVAIQPGEEDVKTFYPVDWRSWFKANMRMEKALKNGRTFTLQELATFHVHAMIAQDKTYKGEGPG